jgi:hypothetical protein
VCAAVAPAGCTGEVPTTSPSTSAAIPDSVLDAVHVEIRQSRADWAARRVQLAVHNDGSTVVEVVSARLTVPTVAEEAATDDGRRVPPGTRRDLTVALGESVCADAGGSAASSAADGPADDRADEPAEDDDAAALVVVLDLVDEIGRTGTVTLAPDDPNGHLTRIHGEDCAALAAARGATLTLADDVTTRTGDDGRLLGSLTLTLTPRTGGPSVEVDTVEGTVLLDPVGAAAVVGTGTADGWTVGLSTAPDGTRTAALELAPSRCDPHAVAEDKRGTSFAVHARVDGVAQPVFYVTASDDLRRRVHEYIAASCGWPAS